MGAGLGQDSGSGHGCLLADGEGRQRCARRCAARRGVSQSTIRAQRIGRVCLRDPGAAWGSKGKWRRILTDGDAGPVGLVPTNSSRSSTTDLDSLVVALSRALLVWFYVVVGLSWSWLAARPRRRALWAARFIAAARTSMLWAERLSPRGAGASEPGRRRTPCRRATSPRARR